MKIDPKHYRPDFIKEALIDEAVPRTCRKCPTKLPSWIQYYCCFNCKEAAQHDGSYGKEEDVIQ
jgi:hypothetical protein